MQSLVNQQVTPPKQKRNSRREYYPLLTEQKIIMKGHIKEGEATDKTGNLISSL